jgi:hypothetical protein
LVHDEHCVPIFVWDERRIAKIQLDELTPVDRQSPYLAHAVTHGLITAAAIFHDVLAQIGQVARALRVSRSR